MTITKKIWIEVTIEEGRIEWTMSNRDTEWLKGHRWSLEFVEIERERWATYEEYLATDWWQQRRKDALVQADYRCQICNAGSTVLNVHHRTYDRLGDERHGDLVVLCRDCHEMFHAQRKLAR